MTASISQGDVGIEGGAGEIERHPSGECMRALADRNAIIDITVGVQSLQQAGHVDQRRIAGVGGASEVERTDYRRGRHR